MATPTVEGEWKDFTFKRITKTDFPILASHLRRSFYVDEPLAQVVGFTDKTAKDLDSIVLSVVGCNLSVAAYHRETGDMVGSLITHCEKAGVEEEEPQLNSVEMLIILDFVTKSASLVDLFEKHGVDKYADFFMVSVDPQCRGFGLATELYNRSITLIKQEGFKVAKTLGTNGYTRALARKLGFEELGRCYFRDIKDSSGNIIAPDLDDEMCAALMVKEF